MSAALSRDAAEAMLTSKLGMQLDRRDHRWYVLEIDGRPIVRTFVSTGGKYKTLGHDLVARMARQLLVTTPFVVELVQCSKTREEYLDHLRQSGRL